MLSYTPVSISSIEDKIVSSGQLYLKPSRDWGHLSTGLAFLFTRRPLYLGTPGVRAFTKEVKTVRRILHTGIVQALEARIL